MSMNRTERKSKWDLAEFRKRYFRVMSSSAASFTVRVGL